MVITLDGPSASGKSTLAQLVAHKLDFYYLSTGMLYRGVAYLVFHRLALAQPHSCTLDSSMLLCIQDLEYCYENNHARLLYKHEDITPHLFSRERGEEASIVSENPLVRQALLPVQRIAAQRYNLIAEGRDCGSIVFPNADYKFYITASLEARAKRIIADHKSSLQEAQEKIIQRDARDSNRTYAPLTVPENAIIIDTTSLSVEQACEEVLGYINK